MSVSIRAMQVADVPQVIAIEQQVQTYPWSKQLFVDSINAPHQCTVIETNGCVAGFCILQPVLDEANLLLMAIDPAFQQRGLGMRLLEQSINSLGEHCKMIFLEVRQSNQAAIGLYEKVGFAQIDLRKNYYPTAQGKEHAVIMALTLDNPFA